MKRLTAVLLSLCICFTSVSCGTGNGGENYSESSTSIEKESSGSEENTSAPESTDILVAYFSCTGNTKQAAEYIKDAAGGDLYEIVPQVPYTKEDLEYYTDCRADREQNDPDARPAINGNVDIESYDIVFIGYPKL